MGTECQTRSIHSRVNITQNKKKNKQWTNKNNNTSTKKPYKIVPYIQGMSESCRNICRKHGVEMYFRGGSTIKDLLVHPKDKDNILQKSGVIYKYKCRRGTAMKSTMESQTGLLEKGSEST